MPPTACASTATQPTPDIGSRTRFGVLMSADNVRVPLVLLLHVYVFLVLLL